MDVDEIPAGIDFVAHLNSQVAASSIVLVVIGPHWLDVKNEAGQRRLNQPDDSMIAALMPTSRRQGS
jgi:hypothetical protein